MTELRKIADSIIPMLKTEEETHLIIQNSSTKSPSWIWQFGWRIIRCLPQGWKMRTFTYINCAEGECLPIGKDKVNPETQGLEGQQKPATRMVPQVNYLFYAKPSTPKTTIMSSSANPWSQKRTSFTQEVIRRLLRTKKELSCDMKQKILNNYMQVLKNSGYNKEFRSKILKAGLKGYNKILDDDRSGLKPLYRSKEWCKSA